MVQVWVSRDSSRAGVGGGQFHFGLGPSSGDLEVDRPDMQSKD